MDLYTENALEEFVKKKVDIFGTGSKFVSFEYESNKMEGTACGFRINSTFGCIRYCDANGDFFSSPPLLVKSTSSTSAVTISEAVLLQFFNEMFFYGHMLPFFTQLESTATNLFPKCYGSSVQSNTQLTEAVIILEDLRSADYRQAPSKSFLDYSHLSLMVKNLGKFHAYSYLAKQRELERFSTLCTVMNPIHPAIIGQSPGILAKIGARGLTRLAQQSEYTTVVPDIRRLLDTADQHMVKLLKHEAHNPKAVICHGDYSSSKVMFRYEEDRPVDIKMIDFAMSTYSSPMFDLALLLYLNADQKTRDLHWDELIDDYYDGLSCVPLEINCCNWPSRENMEYEFRENAFCAYLIASVCLPFLVAQDLGLNDYQNYIPKEYAHYKSCQELPAEVIINLHLKIGGEIGTEVLADILRDIVKRNFIWKLSSCAKDNSRGPEVLLLEKEV